MAQRAWQQYEEYIYTKLKEWAGDQAEVKFDQRLPGIHSGVSRQIDALITGRFAGEVERDITAAVDCKRYTRKVNVKHVEAFLGLVEDVQTDLGLLITNVGYTPAAWRRTRRGVRLRVIEHPIFVAKVDDLPPIYHAAYDEAYYMGTFFDHAPYGPVGATISYTWVDDDGYTRDPEAELDWTDEGLASSEDRPLDWGDDEGRAECARIVLRHRLQREPTEDEVEVFVEDIARWWEDGQEWVVYDGELYKRLGV